METMILSKFSRIALHGTVAQTFSLLYRRFVTCKGMAGIVTAADWKSAIQQTKSLRYSAEPALSLTPRFSGVQSPRRAQNRFGGFLHTLETAEAVRPGYYRWITPLKRGVNERNPRETRAGGCRISFAASFALLITVLLSGCAVGPNHHQPKTEVTSAFGNAGETNLSSAQIVVEWWRGFNDNTLQHLVDQAITNNQDLRIATDRVREARALHTQAVADEFPVVTGNAGYTKSLTSADSSPFPLTRDQRQLELFNLGFDATWELDIFGGVRRSIQAATAEVSTAEANRQDVLITLIAEVARNYFELRGAQHQLDVARKNADNQRETLDLTVARFNAGRATELDTARARAQLNATLAVIPPVEGAIKHSIYRLGVLVGRQPTALEPDLAPPKPIPALPSLVSIGDPATLLRRRPDIRAAEGALAAATARIGVQTASLFPRVFFNGSVGFDANTISRIGEPGTDAYSFGPQITWAALDLGHVLARIHAARANADAQLAAYEKTVLTALEETENALVDFGREQIRRDYLRESAHSAVMATTLARQRYTGGVSDFLPVLDAERSQLEIEAQLAQSETRTATSLVAIYKALGGGWESEQASSR
jgi:NodT family efflux transporter outer membrane factor (OMF) lipoprotein